MNTVGERTLQFIVGGSIFYMLLTISYEPLAISHIPDNNNLHIWELGEILKAVGSIQNTGIRNSYKVLAPKEVATLFKNEDGTELSAGATDKVENADIVVGFNGPMAHVYVQNGNIGEIAEMFRLMMQFDDEAGALKWLGLEDLDYRQIKRDAVGRLNLSIDQILIRISDGGDKSHYCVFDGLNDDGSIKCATNDPFNSTEYVDAWERIDGMNHPYRSGDIVLIMKDKTSGDAAERYTTGSACKSWHGGLNPSDSYVPLIVSYPGGNRKEIESILQKESLCKQDYSGCRGNWKVTDIIKEIITEQYQ